MRPRLQLAGCDCFSKRPETLSFAAIACLNDTIVDPSFRDVARSMHAKDGA